METNKKAVALGLFDGVHTGHRTVIGKAAAMTSKGLTSAVFTFDITSIPEKQGRTVEYIYGNEYRKKLIGSMGISPENIFSFDFSEIKDMCGEEFVKHILAEKLNTAYVVCGKDFRFGKNASCGVNELFALGKKFGFSVETAEDVKISGENISSNRIRSCLKNGDILSANELLGNSYTVSGEVVDGNHIGRTINFPTINQNYLKGQIVPAYGVYRTSVTIDGKIYDSVTNVGIKPTVEGTRNPLAETHILNYSGNLYGCNIETAFCEFIRPETKFPSIDALKAQIMRDIASVMPCNSQKHI